MTFTYDLNTNGVLILRADAAERERLRQVIIDNGGENSNAEAEALEPLIANSELSWIDPNDTGDMTDAPMLGLTDADGEPTARWAFMDYQVRSFLTDLVENGEAVFTC